MKRLAIIIFSFTAITVSFTQPAVTNSSELLTMIKNSKPDTNRINLLLLLSKYYLSKEEASKKYRDSASVVLQEANKLGETSTSEKWRNESRRMLGRSYFETSDAEKGKEFYLKILNELERAGNKNAEVAFWEELAKLIRFRDTLGLTRLNCLEKIVSLYQQMGDKEKEIDALKDIADLRMNLGQLDSAEAILFDVLRRYEAINYPFLHYTYDLLAVTNRYKGDFDKALYYALKTVESMEATHDSAAATTFYSRLANMYRELDQPQNSVKWYWKVFGNRKYEGPVNLYMFRDAGFLVRELIKLNKDKEALAFILDIANKNRPIGIYARASLVATLAYCYHALHQDDLANKYYLNLIGMTNQLEKDNEVTADVNYEAGQYFFDRRQYPKASFDFQQALDVSRGINSLSTIKDIHLKLYNTDSAQGDYISAINHLRKYNAINDSIFNETKSRQIEELDVQYETAQKEKDIQLLNNQNQLQQIKIAEANRTRNIILTGTVLLVIIIGLLFNRYKLKQRSNSKLQIHQKEIDEKNIFLENLIADQNKLLLEKEWLIKEVHHRVKNNLQMIISLLNTQSAYLDNDAAIRAIQDSRHRMQTMSLIHQKLYHSENVSVIDMPVYINELVSYLKDVFSTGPGIRFEQDIAPVKLDVAQAVPVGLILNEVITNAIKYAFNGNGSGVIAISMHHVHSQNLLLSIRDTGKGLPEDFELSGNTSLGMSLVLGLVKQLEGSFELVNKEGVEIIIKFPYQTETIS